MLSAKKKSHCSEECGILGGRAVGGRIRKALADPHWKHTATPSHTHHSHLLRLPCNRRFQFHLPRRSSAWQRPRTDWCPVRECKTEHRLWRSKRDWDRSQAHMAHFVTVQCLCIRTAGRRHCKHRTRRLATSVRTVGTRRNCGPAVHLQ